MYNNQITVTSNWQSNKFTTATTTHHRSKINLLFFLFSQMNRSLRFISTGQNEKAFKLAAVNTPFGWWWLFFSYKDNAASLKIVKTGGGDFNNPFIFIFMNVLLFLISIFHGWNTFMNTILHSDFFFFHFKHDIVTIPCNSCGYCMLVQVGMVLASPKKTFASLNVLLVLLFLGPPEPCRGSGNGSPGSDKARKQAWWHLQSPQ